MPYWRCELTVIVDAQPASTRAAAVAAAQTANRRMGDSPLSAGPCEVRVVGARRDERAHPPTLRKQCRANGAVSLSPGITFEDRARRSSLRRAFFRATHNQWRVSVARIRAPVKLRLGTGLAQA